MLKRYWMISLFMLFLAGCSPAVGPVVSSLTTSQNVIEENQPVSITVTYRNNDGSQAYSNVVLILEYPDAFNFISADQAPENCGVNCLEWKIGNVPASDTGGTIRVGFQVASSIDPAVYELFVSARISGLNAGLTPAPGGGLYSNDSSGGNYSKSLTLYILGRPTPTYPPTSVQEQGSSEVTAAPQSAGPTPEPTQQSSFDPSTVQIIVAVIGGCTTVLAAIIGGYVTLRATRASRKDK